jgi:hypothetical protein
MMSAVTDRIRRFTQPPKLPVEIILVETVDEGGWQWLSHVLDIGDGIEGDWRGGGPYPSQRAALEAAMEACPGWQMVRVA